MIDVQVIHFRQDVYQSGSQVVGFTSGHRPWYYVLGAPELSEEDRHQTRRDLYAWAEYGVRADWMDDLVQESPYRVWTPFGGAIEATGPMYDADPPHLVWREMDGDDCIGRGLLIEALVTDNRSLFSLI